MKIWIKQPLGLIREHNQMRLQGNKTLGCGRVYGSISGGKPIEYRIFDIWTVNFTLEDKFDQYVSECTTILLESYQKS